MTDKQAKKEEKCKGCQWLYNGFCTCSGLKPCTKSKKLNDDIIRDCGEENE